MARLQYFRIHSFENAVFSDGILVFVFDGGTTTLLPSVYEPFLKILAEQPKNQPFLFEEILPEEFLNEGESGAEICQVMIDAGVVADC